MEGCGSDKSSRGSTKKGSTKKKGGYLYWIVDIAFRPRRFVWSSLRDKPSSSYVSSTSECGICTGRCNPASCNCVSFFFCFFPALYNSRPLLSRISSSTFYHSRSWRALWPSRQIRLQIVATHCKKKPHDSMWYFQVRSLNIFQQFLYAKMQLVTI